MTSMCFGSHRALVVVRSLSCARCRALIVVNIACRERHDSRGLDRVGGSSLGWGGKGLACLQVRFSRSRYRLSWEFFLKLGTCL